MKPLVEELRRPAEDPGQDAVEHAVAPITPREELVLVTFGLWMIVGLFLDGWAHSEQRPDSFFTPWHGVLYSGFGGAVAAALWQVRRRLAPGRRWVDAVAPGYGLSLFGLAVFAAGAAGDLVWHQALGIEASLAALLSPTHLLLMVGGVLALTGPLRTAWRRPEPPARLASFLPALVSLLLATAVAIFFTTYASPFARTPAPLFGSTTTDTHDFSRPTAGAFAQLRDMWGLTGILFTTVLVLVPVLLLLRRWRPPRGSLTIYFLLVVTFEVAEGEFRRWPLALAGVAAALVAETLVARRAPLLAVGAGVPAAFWLGYFAAFQAAYGVGWSAELWSGAVVLSTVVGTLLALLATPGRRHLATRHAPHQGAPLGVASPRPNERAPA